MAADQTLVNNRGGKSEIVPLAAITAFSRLHHIRHQASKRGQVRAMEPLTSHIAPEIDFQRGAGSERQSQIRLVCLGSSRTPPTVHLHFGHICQLSAPLKAVPMLGQNSASLSYSALSAASNTTRFYGIHSLLCDSATQNISTNAGLSAGGRPIHVDLFSGHTATNGD